MWICSKQARNGEETEHQIFGLKPNQPGNPPFELFLSRYVEGGTGTPRAPKGEAIKLKKKYRRKKKK